MWRRALARGFFAFEGFFDRVVCVLGAVVSAQAPEFFQQYRQRLGGHLDEAARLLGQFEASARAAGKPWADFVGEALASRDAGIAGLGEAMRGAAARVETLRTAQDALAGASDWSRPFHFLRHIDWSIARATVGDFKPAVPTTLEGAVYAAVGVAVAFGAWHVFVRLPLRRWLRPRHSTVAPVRGR